MPGFLCRGVKRGTGARAHEDTCRYARREAAPPPEKAGSPAHGAWLLPRRRYSRRSSPRSPAVGRFRLVHGRRPEGSPAACPRTHRFRVAVPDRKRRPRNIAWPGIRRAIAAAERSLSVIESRFPIVVARVRCCKPPRSLGDEAGRRGPAGGEKGLRGRLGAGKKASLPRP